ncbi:hypothetical protein Dimus_032463 [Dionaea muscipula]
MEGSTENVIGDTLGQTSTKRGRQNADLFIHEELLVEILARLPVRSLLRFKCVCKTWFSLIESKYFVGKHLSARSMMFKDYNFENLLVDHHHSRDDDNSMCLQFSAVDFDTLSIVRSKFKIVSSSPDSVNRPHPTCLFVGSCNGIVCLLVQLCVGLMTQQSLLLWNPATGEVKDLQHGKVIHVLGFGFDPKKNDYKVVLISYSSTPELTEHMFVYSSRLDSWKSLDRPHGFEFNHLTSTTSSGGRMLNWLGSHHDIDHDIVISFDLSEEAFVTTPMPPGIEIKCKCRWNLQQCRLIQSTPDEPCTVVCFPNHMYDDWECAYFDNEKIIHIWTLNEYGESGSWTKLRSVVVMSDYVLWPYDLLVLWKGGEEVLFEIKQHKRYKLQLASYNLITQQLRFFKLKGWPCLGYTESLVSINGRYGGRLSLDHPNRSVHDVEDIDDSRKKQNYYSLVDDSTGRTISRLHMTEPQPDHADLIATDAGVVLQLGPIDRTLRALHNPKSVIVNLLSSIRHPTRMNFQARINIIITGLMWALTNSGFSSSRTVLELGGRDLVLFRDFVTTLEHV